MKSIDVSGENTASTNRRWISRSDCIARLENPLGCCGFALQHGEGRNVGVPLDQRRPRPETLDRARVERPYVGCNRCPMRIDQAAVHCLETCQMNFRNGIRRYGSDIRVGVEAMVGCI